MLASTTHCQWNTETADFRAPLMQDGPDRKTTTTCANSYYLCCHVPLTRGGLAALAPILLWRHLCGKKKIKIKIKKPCLIILMLQDRTHNYTKMEQLKKGKLFLIQLFIWQKTDFCIICCQIQSHSMRFQFNSWMRKRKRKKKNMMSKEGNNNSLQVYLLIQQVFKNIASTTFWIKPKYALAYAILFLTVMLVIGIRQLHHLFKKKKKNTVFFQAL